MLIITVLVPEAVPLALDTEPVAVEDADAEGAALIVVLFAGVVGEVEAVPRVSTYDAPIGWC